MRFPALILLVLLFGLTTSGAHAQTEIAKYGGEFMATGFGGRALAMGGASVAIAGDVSAAYWNPAGLMGMNYPEIGLMHEQRFGGLLSYNYGGVAWPFGPRYTLALSITRMGVDDIPDTRGALIDLNGNGQLDPNERLDPSRISSFNTADWVAYLTYAFQSNDRLALGVNLKLISRDLLDASAMGVGFDIGACTARPTPSRSVRRYRMSQPHSWPGVPDATNWFRRHSNSARATASTRWGGQSPRHWISISCSRTAASLRPSMWAR